MTLVTAPRSCSLAPRHVVDAVDAAGWDGLVVPRLRLCGLAVYPVVRLDPDTWSARERSGFGPQLHQFTLELWESWLPGLGTAPPPSPVRLVGIAADGNVGAAFRVLDQLSGYAPGLAIATGSRRPTNLTVADADIRGISLAWVSPSSSTTTLLWRGRSVPAPTAAGRTVSLRHKEELIYSRLLANGWTPPVGSHAATA